MASNYNNLSRNQAMLMKYFRIDRKDIALVQFIIEGYGEMATVSTIDAATAVIQVAIIPDFISEMEGLLEYLKIKYHMNEIDHYPMQKLSVLRI